MTNDQREQDAYKKADGLRALASTYSEAMMKADNERLGKTADTIEHLIRDRNALRQTLTKIVEHGVDNASELKDIAREMLDSLRA